ncbi:toxin-antitoxin system HicB family antitoxin [Myceligenerans pegani]|uniref:Toxin-antitoxin system HicB family antitoxin n=1 Tax=Myceligenerans pegani TaxID=2776917 RepID=A0ABR9N3K5_9MICO|nr:toxin-antitoxin system HicB family antitoxin [Myceligenerans sp. TRM 65318]MBE1878240.1 toxin-antitoxin system HicB family antitoxin [Myceligenerans sp. TRM 65318]MBE3020511.1 toxin-antitoxin system HicB family antitoxin [Myceligenerans sp. TRM 65318]
MDITHHVDDLQQRLAVAADAAGEDARQLARRLTAPLDAAVRLVLLDALSEAAGEISAELAPGSVDVRLRGGDPEFVVVPPAAQAAPSAPATAPAAPAADLEGAATSRTTLRLPDRLKAQVEVAAARDGVSVNTWLVRAVAAALDPSADNPAPESGSERRGRNRHTGWVR